MSDTTLNAETSEMGRVTVSATLSNLENLLLAKRGDLGDIDVRQLTIDEALVDTGCTILGLPSSIIETLGLQEVRSRRVRTAGRSRKVTVYEPVRLEVQNRFCTVEVLELPDDSPMLIGQVPLEIMDFVVDPQGQQLIGNPAHNGEWVNEMY